MGLPILVFKDALSCPKEESSIRAGGQWLTAGKGKRGENFRKR